jgi:hypothetical protein
VDVTEVTSSAPDLAVAAGETPAVEPSLADHEAAFQPGKARARASAPDAPSLGTDAAPVSDEAAASADARDEKGRFQPKPKERHRAESQKAGAGDVPRINELTAKLRETERQLEQERASRRQPEPAREPVRESAPAPRQEPPGRPRLQTFIDQLKGDETYQDAVERHAEAVSDWKFEIREQAQRQAYAEQQARDGFRGRVDEARKIYPDYDEVALQADRPSVVQQHNLAGTMVDQWIRQHKHGALALYHFEKNPDDLRKLAGLTPLDQITELSLLGQRLSLPSARTAAATTGSAPALVRKPAPPPPNPVRTAPQSNGDDDEPSDNLSLAAHESRFTAKGRRR